jgi:hypothetical protein
MVTQAETRRFQKPPKRPQPKNSPTSIETLLEYQETTCIVPIVVSARALRFPMDVVCEKHAVGCSGISVVVATFRGHEVDVVIKVFLDIQRFFSGQGPNQKTCDHCIESVFSCLHAVMIMVVCWWGGDNTWWKQARTSIYDS